jgi:hypothetical protein
MLGLMLCSVLILTYLCIDVSQIPQSSNPRLPDAGASMAHDIQNAPPQETSTSGIVPGDFEGEGEGEGKGSVSQSPTSNDDQKGATNRITPQRRPASGGTGILQAR